MKSTRRLSVLAAMIALLSLVLVGLGGYVRGTGAGLSCPDWPLCYGRAIPPHFQNGVMQEVVHRYLASAVSLLTFFFCILSFRERSMLPHIWAAAKFSVAILFFQVILGGLTVLMKLNPFVVTAHLTLGTLFFQTFAFVALALFASPQQMFGEILGVTRRELAMLISLIFCQLMLGGFVGSSGAALACPDLPYCFGTLLPQDASHQQEIHMLHRGLAVVVYLALSLVCVRELSAPGPAARRWLVSAWMLTTLQIILGIMNVLFRVPVHVAVSHLLVAQLILLCLMQAWRQKAEAPIPAKERKRQLEALRFPQRVVIRGSS